MQKTFSWEPLDLDTGIFGFKTAKITHVSPDTISGLKNDLQRNKVRYATYRLPSTDIPAIQTLEVHGFILVDILIGLKAEIENTVLTSDSYIGIANGDDIPRLREIASSIFRFNRFFNDPLIPVKKANEMFALWIENSVRGIAADETLVYRDKEKILGFVTLQNKGHIPLIGVAPHAQGKGIARTLLHAALHSFQKRGVFAADIETQLQNVPAVRSYTAAGFRITDSFVTYRWSDLT